MFFKSIRGRFQLGLAILLAGFLGHLGFTFYQVQLFLLARQMDDQLERRVAAMSRVVREPWRFGLEPGPGRPAFDNVGRPPPPWARPEPPFFEEGGASRPRVRELQIPAEVGVLFDEADTNEFYYAVWFKDGTLIRQSTNAPAGMLLPERPADTLTHSRMHWPYQEAYHFTEMGDCVLAGKSIAADLSGIRRFAAWLLAAGSGVLALGLAAGWWLVSQAMRPIRDISETAERIATGDLSQRINVANTRNELGQLAGVLNSTFARLESSFAQQKQFTADAAHELRTPLAILISEAQTTLARERSAGDYRETVEACLDTAQQMRRLTESLLELARLDAGHEEIPRGPLDVASEVRVCIERLRVLASERGITFTCALGPAETVGNAERFGQVITNLLCNAIQYNRTGGEIRVRTSTEKGAAIVTVADTGQGIAAEDLPHVFERFYRADKSRSRANGRTGLGLAICKAIVETDGGTIEVVSQAGLGSTFTVRMPSALRVPEQT